MVPSVIIMKPKRGPRFETNTITEGLRVVRALDVPYPDLEAAPIRRFEASSIRNTTSGQREVDIPTLVVPMDSTQPQEFMQTVTSTGTPRPVLNLDVWRPFYDLLYRGHDVDLGVAHTVYIGFVRDRNAILVVPAEHPRATGIIWAHRHQLVMHNNAPICMELRTLAGDGHWRKSRTLLSSALFSMIFHGTPVAARHTDFFEPDVRALRNAAPATGSGVRRPRPVQETTDESSAPRAVRPRTVPGGGKGLMGVETEARHVGRVERGMTADVTDAMKLSSLISTIMRDTVSDFHDVVFAQAAITTVRSHLDDPAFIEFIEHISMTSDGTPIVAESNPAELVSGRIVDVISSTGPPAVVNSLNMLSDQM